MSWSSHQSNEETRRFHRIINHGSLEELQAALKEGADVNAPGHVGRTALMEAIASSDLQKMKLLLQHGADPELTDDFNGTPLGHAVDADFADGVRLLLSLGVDRGYHPRYPLKKVDYDFPLPNAGVPAPLKEVFSEAEWKKHLLETFREFGQNRAPEPVICNVQSLEVLKLLLEAGDDLNLAPSEIKRALVGLGTGGELQVAPSEYREHKSPRYGSQNPERMDFPFWKDMIRTGGHAYSARVRFQDTDPCTEPGVVWCYERFGSSLTQLPDGRFVQIGGEHEDYYDPDFFIYNDVVIHDGHGDCQIYGYPQEVFPPTDSHTATLCRDGIYIIGCLGYPKQRQLGFTPVYRLTLESWQIESIETGGEMPGWIYKHRATYVPERNVIRIAGGESYVIAEDGEEQLLSNEQHFELDLSRYQWRRMK